MKIAWILAATTVTATLIGMSIYAYLRSEFAKQRIRQKERTDNILNSPKFMALTPDHQLSLRGYLVKKMDAADRKRILFSTLSNTALAIGGTAPILAMLSSDPMAQKILNAISSVSVLCLGIFSLEKFAIEHRRAGYLLDSLIQEWISEIGEFNGLTEVEAFRLLIRKSKEVLDTGETSFIGAGSQVPEYKPPTVPQPLSVPKSQPTEPINYQSITNQLPTIAQTTQSPVIQSPSENESITLDQFLDEDLGDDDDIDWNTIVTQGNEPVEPSDFAKWQASQLKGEKI